MSEIDRRVGSIGWVDLTVPQADRVRDFYVDVVGWKASSVPMGDYADYGIHRPDDGQMVAGICHARGVNADLPAAWLIYVNVRDLDHSLERVVTQGGSVDTPARSMGGMGRMAVVRDPAGACLALFEQAASGSSDDLGSSDV